MALLLIKKILDSKNNEQLLDANLVVNPETGKNILAHFTEALNLLRDGTADGSGELPQDYNTLLKISNSLAALKTTINDFLTGEDNEGDIDRLSELVKAIQVNKESIDALVMDNLAKSDIVNGLASAEEDKVLSAAQGKALKDLIDALEASVNEKIEAAHTHENQAVLDKITENADGDLEYNGKVLNGATSVAVVASADAAPVFDEKLILVVSPLSGGDPE